LIDDMTSTQLEPGAKIADSEVFDLAMSWRGYRINKMCNALSQPQERDAYKTDEEAFMARFGLTEAEKNLVRARDFQGLLRAGGNIYFLLKLGVVTGNGLYKMGATMRGESYEQFLATRNDSGAV
jgi:protocatechuate 4,5-dioxygenase alpha chain